MHYSTADMSDIVPPEVRPKPVVPAKPPNVGAPSPSSPFPTQGPGIGAGSGASPLPPSAIPVPIGSHGPVHISSHSTGHSVGHGGGHGGGHGAGHAVAHNGGQGHGGSHSSGIGSTLLGYIGIDTIIEQMKKKTMKTGFDFNVMVVGESQQPSLNDKHLTEEYPIFFHSCFFLLVRLDPNIFSPPVVQQVTVALGNQLWSTPCSSLR